MKYGKYERTVLYSFKEVLKWKIKLENEEIEYIKCEKSIYIFVLANFRIL